MFLLWALDIVSYAAMMKFNQDATHQYLVVGAALASILVSGALYARSKARRAPPPTS